MGHWYDAVLGTPVYEVPNKSSKGSMRPTTLRDAKKQNLVPGVTTILKVAASEGLQNYFKNQILQAAINNPYIFGDDEKKWKDRIAVKSKQEGEDAAKLGHKIHDALEQYYKGKAVIPPDLEEICLPAIEILLSTFGPLEWVSEAYFAHSGGYGGKCDLHFKGNKEYPNGIILDFKTKNNTIKPYPENCQQLVAYREGLLLPRAECYNLFIHAKNANELLLHKWEEEQCSKAWKMFSHLLEYWKLTNNFKV